MGYTVTRYKCDLDGVCRVLRDGEMEWVPVGVKKYEQFGVEFNEVMTQTFANTSYEAWNHGATGVIDWYIEASGNMLEAYKVVGLAIGKIIGL